MSFKENIPALYALARQNSEESRVELAGMLADLFLHTPAPLSLRESELVDELIDLLMLGSTPTIHGCLSEKFADVTRMPRRVAVHLALGDIDNARPVLVANPALADEDLIRVIDSAGIAHAQAIARRVRISEAVADALVMTGDMNVMQAVAENLGASLSDKALDIVADAARSHAELRKPVLHRPEMNAETALRLYWWVEQDLRRYALKRFGIASGQVDQALAATISGFLNDTAPEKNTDEMMGQVVDWLDNSGALTIQVLPQVLRMGHFRLFNMLLAHLTQLNLPLIDSIVHESGGRGLAAACRAIGIDKAGFVSLFLLSRGGRPGDQLVHPRELAHALAAFDRINTTAAKDLLRTWKANPDYFARQRDENLPEDR